MSTDANAPQSAINAIPFYVFSEMEDIGKGMQKVAKLAKKVSHPTWLTDECVNMSFHVTCHPVI